MTKTLIHLWNSVRAAIFDMDGLLLDTEQIARRAWQAAADSLGYKLSNEVFAAAVGRSTAETAKLFREKLGETFPFDEARQRRLEIGKEIFEREGIAVKRGAQELLVWCREQKMKVALATSTERPLTLERLEHAGLNFHFDAMVTGSDVVHAKPAPDIFLKVQTALSIPAAECLILEDSNTGVQAAMSANIPVVMVPDLVEPNELSRRYSLRICSALTELLP